jgi:hypothetical protein
MAGYAPCMDRISARRNTGVPTIEPAKAVKQKAMVDPRLQPWWQDQELEDEANTHDLLIPIVLESSLAAWIGFLSLVF